MKREELSNEKTILFSKPKLTHVTESPLTHPSVYYETWMKSLKNVEQSREEYFLRSNRIAHVSLGR